MSRWYSSVIAQKITGNAIEWCGGNGFVRDTGIEKYWRDSKVSNPRHSPHASKLMIRSELSMRVSLICRLTC